MYRSQIQTQEESLKLKQSKQCTFKALHVSHMQHFETLFGIK